MDTLNELIKDVKFLRTQVTQLSEEVNKLKTNQDKKLKSYLDNPNNVGNKGLGSNSEHDFPKDYYYCYWCGAPMGDTDRCYLTPHRRKKFLKEKKKQEKKTTFWFFKN